MGNIRNQTVFIVLRRILNRFSIQMTVCLAGLIILAGCVADSALQSQNMSAILTPEEGQNKQASKRLEPKVSVGETASAPAPVLSPTVKNALISTETAATPAQAAVLNIAKVEPARGQNTQQTSTPAGKKQTSLFGPLLVNNSRNSLRVDNQSDDKTTETKTKSSPAVSDKPQIKQASLSAKPSKRPKPKTRQRRRPRIKATLRDGKAVGLPGVRLKKLFGIDTDETEEFDEPVRVAGVANLARRGTHGLLLQRPDVKVGCFPRQLLSILKRVERRFGRTPIVTSGYRSASYNRRVRGARNSTHIRCHAADIQVKGVSKWKLAKYLRTIPGRGGVGTYCHTKSVHVDIGEKRAWHYCKRRRKKRTRS